MRRGFVERKNRAHCARDERLHFQAKAIHRRFQGLASRNHLQNDVLKTQKHGSREHISANNVPSL